MKKERIRPSPARREALKSMGAGSMLAAVLGVTAARAQGTPVPDMKALQNMKETNAKIQAQLRDDPKARQDFLSNPRQFLKDKHKIDFPQEAFPSGPDLK